MRGADVSMGDSNIDGLRMSPSAAAPEDIRQALLAAGISNFDLVSRSGETEPEGVCIRFSFVEGHVAPDDACRFLATFVQSTVPELQVYHFHTWNDADERVVCVCTRPKEGCDGLILLEQLRPIHAEVRRTLYDAGILSSPNIQDGGWPNYRRDRRGRFGFRISVDVVQPTDHYAFPRDVVLTVKYEPQGRCEEQELRVTPLLFSIRESLVETGSFRYVLAAADTPAPNRETESLHYRRIHLGFNVTDVELLREEREWNDA